MLSASLALQFKQALIAHPELIEPVQKFLTSAKKKFLEPEVEQIRQAMELSITLAVGEGLRPDGQMTYAQHILAVAQRVAAHQPQVDADVVIAGLLHDAVEDEAEQMSALAVPAEISSVSVYETSFTIVRRLFGPRVESIVRAVTNPHFNGILTAQGLDRGHPDYNQRKRELYAAHVIEAIQDADALAVKIADLAENASSLSHFPLHTPDQVELQQFLAAKYLPVVEHAVDFLAVVNRHPEYRQEFLQTVNGLKAILERP